MAALESINIVILLGAVLVLTGILSSLVALRFGAPLLLIFLAVGVLAGESGPGGISFNNVSLTYTVGSVALALILFDGGLRTRFATFRSVLAPAGTLATLGVLLTAAVTAPVAHYLLDLGWTESLLVGAVVASTDAAAVFFLMHSRGLRLRPRVGATIEVESGTNDPFAIFLAIVLVEIILHGAQAPAELARAVVETGCDRPDHGHCRRLRHHRGAESPDAAARPARAIRRDRCGGDLRRGGGGRWIGLSRGLSCRADGRQPGQARPFHHRRISRCRHLARRRS